MEKRNGETEWKNGKKEGKLEIAKKLLKINLPLEQIMELTELTEEEIKND